MVKKRSKRTITYHKRSGKPVIHKSKTGKKYIMVRKSGGGTKKLYQGSKYRENGAVKRLKL
jgi:secreted trypsin-like serine protease